MRFSIGVVIPAFNEEKRLPVLLKEVNDLKKTLMEKGWDSEFVVVDDGSTDGTKKVVQEFDVKYIYQDNQGKGAAVKNGANYLKTDYLVVLDADCEYLAMDIVRLVEPLNRILDENKKNISISVYGSRYKLKRFPYIKLKPYRNQRTIYLYFNHLLSILFLLRRGVYISDLLTGYKLYAKETYTQINPQSGGFETDHEISRKLVDMKARIIEVSVEYRPRSREEGKKIGIGDGLNAIRELLK